MKALIQKLVESHGPSGYEAEIRRLVRQEVASYADEVWEDNLGNLIAHKGAPETNGQKIMLAAHMDEIGLMATHIDGHGFIRFLPIGGVMAHTCVGSRVRFLSGTAGLIGMEVLDQANKLPAFEQMFIDVGAASQEDCPVKVGDVAVFERPFVDLGNRLISKAMDDRIGVAILIETLRKLSATPHQVFFVFSVQEEVGVRGATTAAYGLDPDVGLALDVTRSGDTPRGVKMEVRLGAGPAIKVRDQGMLSDPRVVSWMATTAEAARIPYQLEVLAGGSTDARAIQLTRAGVLAGCLSIPCRYIHSPSEMVALSDVQHAVALMLALLQSPVNLLAE
jgi:endoglucanase